MRNQRLFPHQRFSDRYRILRPNSLPARFRGTGQIREKVKEDENGTGIPVARSLSSEPGEGAEGSKQTGRILNHESFWQNKARQETQW